MEQKSYDYLVKIVLCGPEASGKTSIVNRYTNDEFTPDYNTTIGIEFTLKILKINVGG